LESLFFNFVANPMPVPPDPLRELQILEQIESDSDVTQIGLAETLGVAVGTINFVVKRLVKKGYVRVKQLERRRLKYIITPAGIALRTKLAMDSIRYSMRLYREIRTRARSLLGEARKAGHQAIRIEGAGDLADVVRLTCLEQGVLIVTSRDVPAVKVEGMQLRLEIGSNHGNMQRSR
jgi:DNA-binding MarR family transcriptional regulator